MREKVWWWTKRIWRILGRLALAVVFFAGANAQNTATAFAQQATTTAKLERGQALQLFLSARVDSETSKVGDRMEFTLRKAVMTGTQTVLPADWPVTAHVTKVQSAGKNDCKRGLVKWEMDTMNAPDGTSVELISLRGRALAWDGPDKVHLPTTSDKFEKVVEAPFIAMAFIVFLPAIIAITAGEASETEPCRGQPGAPEIVPARTTQYAAVRHDVKIKVQTAITK